MQVNAVPQEPLRYGACLTRRDKPAVIGSVRVKCMPFLVLDRNGEPLIDEVTGLICQFETREAAEAYRKAHKAARVIEVPRLWQ